MNVILVVPGWGFRHPDVPLRPSMVLATLGVSHEMSGAVSMVKPCYAMLKKPQQGSVRLLVHSNITLNNGYVHDTTLTSFTSDIYLFFN